MKKLIVGIVLFAASCFVNADDARTARLERFRIAMQSTLDAKGIKDRLVVEDTHENVDLGAGDGPLVLLKLPKTGRECLVALHPTDEKLSATLGCADVAPIISI